MNYKNKYLKYKIKYLNTKKNYGGSNKLPPSFLKIDDIIPANSCNQICEKKEKQSDEFIKINDNYEDILKDTDLHNLNKRKLIEALTNPKETDIENKNTTEDYYRRLLEKHKIIYSNETYNLIIQISNILNSQIVILGTGETLADIGLEMLEKAHDNKNTTSTQIENYLINYNMILSSMKKWSPKKNQAIIIDTFIDVIDESSLEKDIWNIINGTLALIVYKDSIFIKDNKTYFDFNIAIHNVGCKRITKWEMCLIDKYLLKNKDNFDLYYISLDNKYSMIFFVKK